MVTISSHVLDSVIGDHGKGIRIECYRSGETGRSLVFDVLANDQGRIAETIQPGHPGESSYELVFHAADYFAEQADMPDSRQIMEEVVVRFRILEDMERIHIPLVLSPHAYSIWWSA